MTNPATVTANTLRGAVIKDDNGSAVGWKSKYITLAAPTDTVVKSGAGMLHTITFNSPVATCVAILYDNTAASGTAIIGTITIPASPKAFTLVYDVVFNTGLTIDTATAASDITVTWI